MSPASGILTPYTIASTSDPHWAHMAYDFGGVGGRHGKDGPDATGLHFGIGRNTIPQVEPVELRCPLIVEGVELIADSGGTGQWRGGAGSRTTFLVLEDAVVTMRCDRYRFPPPGIDGGGPGQRRWLSTSSDSTEPAGVFRTRRPTFPARQGSASWSRPPAGAGWAIPRPGPVRRSWVMSRPVW